MPSTVTTAMPNRFGSTFASAGNVVGVLAFLERPELRVGGVDGLLHVSRRLRVSAGLVSVSTAEGEQRRADGKNSRCIL